MQCDFSCSESLNTKVTILVRSGVKLFIIIKYHRKLRNPGVDGRIILKWIFEEWNGVMDWIDLAQDMDRWRAVVNAVMNLLVS